jgi:hypothetical protein
MRAYRIITGRQKTVAITPEILAAAFSADSIAPLIEYLGPGLVAAIQEAAKQS